MTWLSRFKWLLYMRWQESNINKTLNMMVAWVQTDYTISLCSMVDIPETSHIISQSSTGCRSRWTSDATNKQAEPLEEQGWSSELSNGHTKFVQLEPHPYGYSQSTSSWPKSLSTLPLCDSSWFPLWMRRDTDFTTCWGLLNMLGVWRDV